VDEEAPGRWPVSHDALRPDAESGMRVLFVRCYPAVGVTPPAEFGERLIESIGERGQNCLGEEVANARLLSPGRHRSEAEPHEKHVERGRRDVTLLHAEVGGCQAQPPQKLR
jgi:hypothetical protein